MKTLTPKELMQVMTPKVVMDAFDILGYRLFLDTKKPFNLNFGAVRSNDLNSNKFNDVFFYLYSENRTMKVWSFLGTTDPGLYYRNHPDEINKSGTGTGIMIPQQVLQMYAIAGPTYFRKYGSRHRGHGKTEYTCLRQDKPAYFVRDNDQNDELNVLESVQACKDAGLNVIYENISANHHRASKWQTSDYNVDKFSGACQVTKLIDDYKREMGMWKFACQYWGRFLTYSLMVENTILKAAKLI